MSTRWWVAMPVLGGVLTVAALALGAEQAATGPKVVHSEPSPYGTVLVIEQGRRRYLRFDSVGGDDQSMIDLDDPKAVPMDYIRTATVGLLYPPAVRKVLMIGLGGGTFSGLLRQVTPETRIEIAEINPVVASVAKTFFRVKEDDHLKITLGDGKQILEKSAGGFDLIFIDAYVGAGIPAHLRTPAFFELAKHRLAQDGVVVSNISADRATERALLAAMKVAMPRLACFRTDDSLNLIAVASPKELPGYDALVGRAESLQQKLPLPFSLPPIAALVDSGCARALSAGAE